jgi:PAS domain S-box-containing protein
MNRILLVDDDPRNLFVLKTSLKLNGFDVETAENGAQALDVARRRRPALVISEILLTEMDGFELCRQWKADPQLRDIPLVFYTTTYTDVKARKLCLRLGADRFIVKPQKPEMVVRIVREILKNSNEGASEGNRGTPMEEAEFLARHNEVLSDKLQNQLLRLNREIHERRQVERALREERKLLRRLMENSQDAVLFYHVVNGRVVDCNTKACGILGYTRGELLQLSITDIDSWLEIKATRSFYTELPHGAVDNAERALRRKDGSVFPVRVRLVLLDSMETEELTAVAVVQTVPTGNRLSDLPDRKLLRPAEVAKFMDVSVKTVYRWCELGLIESFRLNKTVRVLKSSLVEFLSLSHQE